jgi:RimJ/RimL family protein N-acetyltransferase
LLRPLTIGDVDALLAYRSRPDVCRYVPFEPMTREVINERLTAQWANTGLTDEGQALTLGVEVAETGELVGDVMLFWHSREHGGGEIGYVLHPDFGGRGYATEAAHALLLVHNEFFKGEWSTELDFAMLADEWSAHRSA